MKKSGLFKIILILLVVISLLTWFVPASYYSGTEMVDLGMYRVGFFDFFQFILLTFQFQYFIQVVFLILAVGAFYGVLTKTGVYRSTLEKIAKKIKGKEKAFIGFTALLFALMSSILGLELLLFLFIPAVISIILLLGYDKITAFLTTFISILVGIIGSTLSHNVVGMINETTQTTLKTQIYAKIALLVISFVIFLAFTLKYATKNKSNKLSKETIEELEENYIGQKKSTKMSSMPIYIVFSLLFILLVLASTSWSNTFGINAFANLHKAITEFTIKDHAIFQYLIGNIVAFGEWAYGEISIIAILAALLIGKIYKVKCSDTFAAMLDGAKKVLKPALLIVFAYSVVYVAGNTLSFGTITNFMLGLTDNLNIVFTSLLVTIGSVLHIDIVYLSNYILPQFINAFPSQIDSLVIITQALYGLTMFIAPTSVLMILGLEYLGISYKSWLKTSWKLVLQLLAIIFIIVIATNIKTFAFDIIWILSITLVVIYMISLWKIFEKAGKKGWISLIPIYNAWTLLQIVGLKGWYVLIPGFNAVVLEIIVPIKLVKYFKKSSFFAAGLIILPVIFYPILGFSKIPYSKSKK